MPSDLLRPIAVLCIIFWYILAFDYLWDTGSVMYVDSGTYHK
jgi:hypothetical protein